MICQLGGQSGSLDRCLFAEIYTMGGLCVYLGSGMHTKLLAMTAPTNPADTQSMFLCIFGDLVFGESFGSDA